MAIKELPQVAAAACRQLNHDLLDILGEDLVATWVHGGTTFAERHLRPGDLDVCAVIADTTPGERDEELWRADPTSRPHRIYEAQEMVAKQCGVEFDTMYLLAEEVGRAEPPFEAFRRSRQQICWPIYRAHWLAGQYVLLHGLRPQELVIPPGRAELQRALDRELEHLERHVYEGDASDPDEATYAILNGCRILYALRNGDPVVSKRAAGEWGIDHLAAVWHDAIRAAGRSYDGIGSPTDDELLRVTMPRFVEMVREELPVSEPRPCGPPRWS